VWTGLVLGAIYTLVAVGYNIAYSAAGVFNFAHAALMVLGTFVAYWAGESLGAPVVVAALLGAGIVAVVGVVEERIAIRPLLGKGLHGELVTTVGVTVVIEGVIVRIWGSEPLRVGYFGTIDTWKVFGVRILPVEALLVALAVVVALGAWWWGRTTMAGLASRATTEDRDAAMLRGVNVRRLSLGAFAVSGLMAGALGPVLGSKTFAVASLGFALALKGFVALAMGGFGSQVGALVGGMAIGVVQAFAGRHWGGNYENLAVFAVLLAVLMLRPTGLFGRTRERVV
jgi:branched-chain amino acid transport system permease protein